jgi:hypothetical protein
MKQDSSVKSKGGQSGKGISYEDQRPVLSAAKEVGTVGT